MAPELPTAQTWLASMPHSADINEYPPPVWVDKRFSADQTEPFHFHFGVPSPHVQTLFVSLPHTPYMVSVVLEVCINHAVPFHFRIVP